MDCKSAKRYIQGVLKNGAIEEPSAAFKAHLKQCTMCRKASARPPADEKPAGKISSDPVEAKKNDPLKDDPADSFPDVSSPVEFKDAPITFTLIANGREEEIKVVEPQLDYPLPAGARLMVHEKEVCRVDVTFTFVPQNGRPYQLDFAVKDLGADTEPHIKTYGDPGKADKGLNSVFSERIIERGGVEAWIEMTKGSARIFIRYAP